jgi:hypothetical protein
MTKLEFLMTKELRRPNGEKRPSFDIRHSGFVILGVKSR